MRFGEIAGSVAEPQIKRSACLSNAAYPAFDDSDAQAWYGV
jgi:hypothetical protein